MFEVHGADRLERVLDRLSRVGSPQIVKRLGDLMLRRTQQRFITKRDPDDEPWKEWSEAYEAERPAAATLLMDSRKLLRSIETRLVGDVVQIGSDRPYAGYVQAVRPFFGVGRHDEDELMDLFEGQVAEAFNAV